MLQHVLDMYDEMLEELMGAQKYVKESYKASSDDEKSMYQNMAKQEAMHAEFLMKSVDKKVSESSDENVKVAWTSLRSHVCEWKEKILESVK